MIIKKEMKVRIERAIDYGFGLLGLLIIAAMALSVSCTEKTEIAQLPLTQKQIDKERFAEIAIDKDVAAFNKFENMAYKNVNYISEYQFYSLSCFHFYKMEQKQDSLIQALKELNTTLQTNKGRL